MSETEHDPDPTPPAPADCDDASHKEYHEAYRYFANRLRIWLAIYGIGAIALMASQEQLTELLTANEATWITLGFLFGAGIQAIYVAIHKWSQWALHLREPDSNGTRTIPAGKREWINSLATHLCEAYWLDFVTDAGAMIAYTVATLWLVRIASLG